MSQNQRICRKLVDREVIYCVSQLINEMSKNERLFDEVIDLLQQEDYHEPVRWYIDDDITVVEAMEWLLEQEMVMPYTGNAKKQLKRYLKENEGYKTEEFAMDHGIDPEVHEALEHYIVSEWFAKKLEEKGEIIDDDFMGMTIWGRGCSGQAIFLDGVVKEIASDIGILAGQPNSWAE